MQSKSLSILTAAASPRTAALQSWASTPPFVFWEVRDVSRAILFKLLEDNNINEGEGKEWSLRAGRTGFGGVERVGDELGD